MPQLEIACFNVDSAVLSQEAGADRVELCHDYSLGGITPPYEALVSLKARLHIPIFVMIRPRGGDFSYSAAEFDQMRADITRYADLADGFVFGILDREAIDKTRSAELVQLAAPKPCTFHRAFDQVGDIYSALEDVIQCRFSTILTSGGSSNATQGLDALAMLISKAGGRIQIMPGGGVRASNIKDLGAVAPAKWWHSSAIIGDKDENANGREIVLLKSHL